LRVYENRELRKICGPGREVIGDWRVLHKEELTDLYSSSNIIQVISSMRWAGHVEHVGFWWGNMRVRDHMGDLGIDGRIY